MYQSIKDLNLFIHYFYRSHNVSEFLKDVRKESKYRLNLLILLRQKTLCFY